MIGGTAMLVLVLLDSQPIGAGRLTEMALLGVVVIVHCVVGWTDTVAWLDGVVVTYPIASVLELIENEPSTVPIVCVPLDSVTV